MARYVVRKSCPLSGTVSISGSKNAVLPILAATLLTEEKCEIMDVPKLRDVDVMCRLIECIGGDIHADYDHNTVETKTSEILAVEAPYELVKKMRASILVMGPLLARTGKAKIALPGGCAIGARPIDLHLKGFEALGVNIEENNGYIEATVDNGLKGCDIYLDFPSVGATEKKTSCI